MRHWRFCLEDLMSICLAREVFGVHVEQVQKTTLVEVMVGILLGAMSLFVSNNSKIYLTTFCGCFHWRVADFSLRISGFKRPGSEESSHRVCRDH